MQYSNRKFRSSLKQTKIRKRKFIKIHKNQLKFKLKIKRKRRSGFYFRE